MGADTARTAHSFTPEEVHRALLTLAKHAGNARHASEELADNGLDVSDVTLGKWRNGKHAQLYNKLHETYGREIEASLVPEFRDLAISAANTARLAVTQAHAQLEAGQAKDPAATAKNLTTAAAIAMDKVYLATDRPTEIRSDRTAQEILASLHNRAPSINTTAVELLSESSSLNARTDS